jgi:hypothetical protein
VQISQFFLFYSGFFYLGTRSSEPGDCERFPIKAGYILFLKCKLASFFIQVSFDRVKEVRNLETVKGFR